MKTSEILLACSVLSVLAGGGAALAAGAFLGSSAPRADAPSTAREASLAASEPGPASDVGRELDALRLENSALSERLAALERQLAETARTREVIEAPRTEALGADASSRELASLLSGDLSPEFVERVDEAMATIEARKAAEREQKRKELQAVRIEEKLTELQTKLGLSNRQTSDLRSTLITQDDKREKLFAAMRDEQGDPRSMRDGFRTIRDETLAELGTFLTPEQLEGYKQSEEREWGRGGGERGGPPGMGTGPGPGFEGVRPQRDGR